MGSYNADLNNAFKYLIHDNRTYGVAQTRIMVLLHIQRQTITQNEAGFLLTNHPLDCFVTLK